MNACAEYKRWLENVDDDALLKEMQNLSDTDIAEAMGYDRSTIARHRRRLIKLIAFRLYGSSAAYGTEQQWS